MGRKPVFSKLPPTGNEDIEDLRKMVAAVDRFLRKRPRISEFWIMHSIFLGYLERIFGKGSGAVGAWDSIRLVDIPYGAFGFDSVSPWANAPIAEALEMMEPDAPALHPRDLPYWSLEEGLERYEIDDGEFDVSRGSLEEARRILLDCLQLVARGETDGPVDPVSYPERLDLGFIEDRELRVVCHKLYGQAFECMQASAYVACTVLLGALLEGILSSVAQQQREDAINTRAAQRQRNDPIDKWDLETLIGVASELGWISYDTWYLADRLRNMRNLIHPNKLAKDGPVLDVSSTKSLITTVEACIRDVNSWLQQAPASE